MKICFYNDFTLGVLNGDQVVDMSEHVKDIPMVGPHDLINGLIENFEDYRGVLKTQPPMGSGCRRHLSSFARLCPGRSTLTAWL